MILVRFFMQAVENYLKRDYSKIRVKHANVIVNFAQFVKVRGIDFQKFTTK